jgi:hypothetical protein
MKRVTHGTMKDYYLCPITAKLKTLVVSCTPTVNTHPKNGTWKRTKIRNVAPWGYRLALWPVNHVEMKDEKDITTEDKALIVAKWIPSALGLIVLVRIDYEGQLQRTLLTA